MAVPQNEEMEQVPFSNQPDEGPPGTVYMRGYRMLPQELPPPDYTAPATQAPLQPNPQLQRAAQPMSYVPAPQAFNTNTAQSTSTVS